MTDKTIAELAFIIAMCAQATALAAFVLVVVR